MVGLLQLVFLPDGKYIISGGKDKKVKLWNISNGEEIRTFEGHTNVVISVGFSQDGKQIISGDLDGWVILGFK